MSDKNRLEEEFYNSQTYKNLNKVGGKVVKEAFKVVEDVAEEIGSTFSGSSKRSPKNNYNTVNPPKTYNPPPPPKYNYQQSNNNNKNPGHPYDPQQRYTNARHPYDQGQNVKKTYNAPPPPVKNYTPPPPPAYQYTQNTSSVRQGVPPQEHDLPNIKKKPKKEKRKRYYTLRVFSSIFAGLLSLEALTTFLPFAMTAPALTAVIVILVTYLGTYITKSKKEKLEEHGFWGIRITLAVLAAALCMDLIPIASVAVAGAALSATLVSYLGSAGAKQVNKFRVKKRERIKYREEMPEIFHEDAQHFTTTKTEKSELESIIEDGKEYIKKLKKADDDIAHEGISDCIVRMENACIDIFKYIVDKPEKIPQIKKFLNYYLPTTLKLLSNYDNLSRQAYKGENITATMFEIEGMMNTVALAFEKQLDSLFSQDAMDIQADISVFESILNQEGLNTGKGDSENITLKL